MDHIRPVVAGGETAMANLALACVSCSLRKGARRLAVDPESNELVPLFHPREQKWTDHFNWKRCRVAGRTPTGRATAEALKMNRQLAVAIRDEESLRGRHPPSSHSAL